MIAFDGPVWRLLDTQSIDAPISPVKSPEGRFHHAGQTAVYASLSAEGAGVAIQRYLTDGVQRMLVPLWLDASLVVDHRGDPAASIVWQDIRATGAASPTWSFSDKARMAGGQAMLYSSRSHPDLGHVVVFDPACLKSAGAPTPFTP
ncbi:MAG: RES family NAD+ phosphorylase [Silicimonas sp.]|nr:RES family NAD+ phosphorylase [Silicimonas sp.]